MFVIKGLIALSVLLISHTSLAIVMDYDIGKARFYEQTASDTAPTTPTSFVFFSQVSSDNDNDFTSVSLSGAPDGEVAYSEIFGGFSWDIYEEFPSEAEIDNDFPDGDYQIEASSALGTIREPVAVNGSFPAAIPYFTGGVADALQNIDPSQSITLSWNESIDSSETIVFVDDVLSEEEIFYLETTPNITSTTIPANLLEVGREYLAVVIFINGGNDDREGFSSGFGKSNKANLTEFAFTVVAVPEPAALSLLGIAVSLMGARRSRQ